jgi:hypothetical protein
MKIQEKTREEPIPGLVDLMPAMVIGCRHSIHLVMVIRITSLRDRTSMLGVNPRFINSSMSTNHSLYPRESWVVGKVEEGLYLLGKHLSRWRSGVYR